MAVSETTLAVEYAGNGSSLLEYEITFPFLDKTHIYAAVSSDGIVPPVLLSPSAYTVTRLADGSGGALKTSTPVVAPGFVRIFRSTPLTQPTVFEDQGPFPAESAETGFDRLLMQVQELSRRMDQLQGIEDDSFIRIPSNPLAKRDVAVWQDSTERTSVAPRWIGQLGVEKGSHTIWIGVSLAAGGWEEFKPRRTQKLTIGLLADSGSPTLQQTNAATVLGAWGVDAVLFAGDNNYNGEAGYENDWSIFNPYVSGGIAFPALGNHDLDTDGYEALHNAKFDYIPVNSNGHRRYYTVVLGGGLVQLFVLNSGKNSLGDVVETDGINSSSVQAQWFAAELAKSRARWKIVMFHHPFVTASGEADRVISEMFWPTLSQVDLICCGHTHLLEILQAGPFPMVVNLSSSIHLDGGPAEATLQGSFLDVNARLLWADDAHYGVGRINVTEERINVEVWDHDRRICLHGRDVRNFNGPPKFRDTWRVVSPLSPPTADVALFVGTICDPSLVQEVLVTVATAGTIDMEFQIHAGLVLIASGTLPFGESLASVVISVPPMIPRGTKLTFTQGSYPSSGTDALGVDVTLIGVRYN